MFLGATLGSPRGALQGIGSARHLEVRAFRIGVFVPGSLDLGPWSTVRGPRRPLHNRFSGISDFNIYCNNLMDSVYKPCISAITSGMLQSCHSGRRFTQHVRQASGSMEASSLSSEAYPYKYQLLLILLWLHLSVFYLLDVNCSLIHVLAVALSARKSIAADLIKGSA